MNSVYAKICNVQSGTIKINNRQIESTVRLYRWLTQVEVLATRANMAPAIRCRPNVAIPANPGGIGSNEPANLIGNPANLHVVWNGYEIGVGGNKSAKYFTKIEHSRVKYIYSHSMVFSKGVLERMIRMGTTCDAAIVRI